MLPIPAPIVSASPITLNFNPSTDTLQFHEQHAQMHSIDMGDASSPRFSRDMPRLEQTVSISVHAG